MAVIIYGTREYGRVDAHDGEHAATRFFHIWFAPLFPVGSSWHTGRRADGTNAHAIKLYGKSVAAAYLRIWGPVVAIGCLSAGLSQLGARAMSAGAIGTLAVAALALLLTAWSWTWRSLRGSAAIRRSDFNFVAFGTRCEPHRLLGAHRVLVKRDLDRRWSDRNPSRDPNEVAQHGAANAGEAVLAYGLLRLSAIERGRAGAGDGADADRILAGKHDAPSTIDGPYREAPTAAADAATQAELAELVGARAAETAKVAAAYAPDKHVELRRQKRRGRLQLAGLVFLSLATFGGVLALVESLQTPLEPTFAQLDGMHPPLRHAVKVTCDAIDDIGWQEVDAHGSVKSEIQMCRLGKKLLPVKLAAHAVPGVVIEGKLYEITDRQPWVRDLLHSDPRIENRTLGVYVDTTGNGEAAFGAMSLALCVITPILWGLWFRARRRRKATAAALAAT